MRFVSRKSQIYISLAAIIVISGISFWLVFPKIESSNLNKVGQVISKSKQYQDLLQQQASFEAGKSDLGTLAKKPYQPTDFFSKDTSVVNEIETLESIAKQEKLSLDFTVSGTKVNAPKAPTAGNVVQIPYTVSVTGSLNNVYNFLQRFENLKFVTQAQSIDLASVNDGQIKANLSAVFFVQK